MQRTCRNRPFSAARGPERPTRRPRRTATLGGMRALLALCLAVLALPSGAQVRAVPPGPRGAYMTQLRLQTQALTSASVPLPQAFAATLAPAPALATPEAFAARAALVEALAAPKTALPALVAAVSETDGRKAAKAAKALEGLAAAVAAAPAAERAALARRAGELHRLFDGATAAPGETVDLDSIPTDPGGPGERKSRRRMKEDRSRLQEAEEMLAAGKARAVLVVLQGMDTAGKDGLIKRPLRLNPNWTKVASFKKPTPEEAARDFLERIEKKLPQNGEITIFNRSHYEDILVPMVLGTHPKEEVESRYRRVLEWERKLVESGVVIVKLFAHVSKPEQRRRLQARVDDPDKRWKFSPSDLETRAKWDEFLRGYGEILARTSPAWAPWRVVGADFKPRRDASVARVVRKVLERMGLSWPSRPEYDGVKVPK